MPAERTESGARDGGGQTEVGRGGEIVHDVAAFQALAVQLQGEEHHRKWLVREAGVDRDGQEAKPDEPKQFLGEGLGPLNLTGNERETPELKRAIWVVFISKKRLVFVFQRPLKVGPQCTTSRKVSRAYRKR